MPHSEIGRVVASVGAATVGCGWAVVFLAAGYTVRMFDSNSACYSQAEAKVGRALDLLAKNGHAVSVQEAMGRLSFSRSLSEAVEDVIYVQESIVENRWAKRELMEQLDSLLPHDAALGSSTSSILGSEFLCGLEVSPRAIVAHPANPCYLVPVVELCATESTTPDTVNKVTALLRDLGMTPVLIEKEILGYVLNRLQAAVIGEALFLVGEGYISAIDVDRIMTAGLGRRWASSGPFLTGYLNAPDGYRGYMARYGTVYRELIGSLNRSCDWTPEQIERIDLELRSCHNAYDREELEWCRNDLLAKLGRLCDSSENQDGTHE